MAMHFHRIIILTESKIYLPPKEAAVWEVFFTLLPPPSGTKADEPM